MQWNTMITTILSGFWRKLNPDTKQKFPYKQIRKFHGIIIINTNYSLQQPNTRNKIYIEIQSNWFRRNVQSERKQKLTRIHAE